MENQYNNEFYESNDNKPEESQNFSQKQSSIIESNKKKNEQNHLKEAPEQNKVIDFDYSLLKPLFQNIDFKKENIILLTTGSYNPIHRMHIEILNIAYKYLLMLNKYNIICGLISPNSDCYVIHKQPPLIPYNLRCEMIETAIKELKVLLD